MSDGYVRDCKSRKFNVLAQKTSVESMMDDTEHVLYLLEGHTAP